MPDTYSLRRDNQVSSSRINEQKMDRNMYQCTAGDLATRDVTYKMVDEEAGSVEQTMTERGYDVAPVHDGDQPIGYVERENLSAVSDSASISDHISRITLDEIISTDATFADVLNALCEEPFYFLGGRNQVTGLLTRADLNTSPSYIHLYDRVSLLEEQLRDLVREHAPEWMDNSAVDLHPETRKTVRERYERAERANIELDPIDYTQFSTLAKVVWSIEDCWQHCDFRNSERAENYLDDVVGVRNAVAHSNLLVENTEGGLMSGRTVSILLEAYETVEQCLDTLGKG